MREILSQVVEILEAEMNAKIYELALEMAVAPTVTKCCLAYKILSQRRFGPCICNPKKCAAHLVSVYIRKAKAKYKRRPQE